MKLLEVVRHDKTSDSTFNDAVEYGNFPLTMFNILMLQEKPLGKSVLLAKILLDSS